MTSRLALVASILFVGQAAFAGAGNGTLDCKSASGRTVLAANYPVDFTSAAATLTVDGQSISYVNQDMVDDAELNNEDLSKSYPNFIVKQVKATRDNKSVSLWIGVDSGQKFDENDLVLTSTGAVLRTKIPNGFIQKFNATLNGTDPRNQQADLPTITLSCQLKYQI